MEFVVPVLPYCANVGGDLVAGRSQDLRRGPRRRRHRPRDPGRRVLLHARAERLRQDHGAADDRRVRGTDLGADPPRRRGRDRPPAVRTRREHRVPGLRAVPAHGRPDQRRVRPAGQEGAEGRAPASAPTRHSRPCSSASSATRRPNQLSGGQRQRVALARALVNRPKVLLLDEPLGALDLKLRREMQIELKEIQRDVGITFVFVTHDQEEALTMSDRIAVFNDGRIEQVATPTELYESPGDLLRGRLRRYLEPAHRGGRARRVRPPGNVEHQAGEDHRSAEGTDQGRDGRWSRAWSTSARSTTTSSTSRAAARSPCCARTCTAETTNWCAPAQQVELSWADEHVIDLSGDNNPADASAPVLLKKETS